VFFVGLPFKNLVLANRVLRKKLFQLTSEIESLSEQNPNMYAVNRLKKNGLKRTKIVTVLRVSLLTQHTQRVTTSHAQAKQNTTARKRKHGAAWTTGRAAFSCTIVQFHKKQLTNNALSTKIVHSLSLRFSHTARHEPKHTPNIFKQRRHAAVCKQSKNIAWENS
jgi:hypothetical protein